MSRHYGILGGRTLCRSENPAQYDLPQPIVEVRRTLKQRPNIILFVTDQQRADCMGYNGHPTLLTPNMDYIAASGVNFTKAYSLIPSCIPARQAIMSGKTGYKNGFVGMGGAIKWDPSETLATILADAGYQTAIVGKGLHQHKPEAEYGFEFARKIDSRFNALPASEDIPEQAKGHWGHGISRNGWTARPWHLPEWTHFTYRTVNDALEFLDTRDESRPFFLMVTFIGPHPPFVPPAFYMDRYLRQKVKKPAIGKWAKKPAADWPKHSIETPYIELKGEALASASAGYLGMINHIDDQMYRILGMRPRLPKNTCLAFVSDHGEMMGDHYLFRKTYPYEGSARVPMCFSGYGIKQSIQCDSPVALSDIAPTVLDLIGVPIPDSMDGENLAPILKGERKSTLREFVHGEHARTYNNKDLAHHFLTDGKKKYIWFSNTGKEQLFNIAKDPNETSDLSNRFFERKNISLWRARLAKVLADRPEGFVEKGVLVPGKPHLPTVPIAVP